VLKIGKNCGRRFFILGKYDDTCPRVGQKLIFCQNFGSIQINRKLRVATKIMSKFFWFLMCYWAAEKLKNDYLSSA
jgi:hypothetical protein